MVNYSEALSELKKLLSSDDVVVRELVAGGKKSALIYVDGMSDTVILDESVLKKLSDEKNAFEFTAESLKDVLGFSGEIQTLDSVGNAAAAVADGDVVFLADGAADYFVLSIRKFNTRAIVEPPTSAVLKGPREGFIEDLKVNLTLIRRRLRTPSLRVKQLKIGRYTNSPVAVLWLDGVATPESVSKITERLQKIDIDGVLDSSYIADFLKEKKVSIFEQVGMNEKPDMVAAKLLEGRVAIVVDGSPMVLTLPFILLEHFQYSYDYYTVSPRATFLRMIRLLGIMFSVLLPGAYVAMQEFHYHLLPLNFLVTVQGAISGIPFSPPMEMLAVILIFEVLQQASVRMPKFLGVALSIVGAIVLGETAVNAGLISSPAVLVVALSALGTNIMPDELSVVSTFRLLFVLVASVLGLYGMLAASMVILTHLASFDSYGAPYLAPNAPMISSDMKDNLFKANLYKMKTRPKSVPNVNGKRMGDINENR